MTEVMTLSRFAFQTANVRTFPVSGTGRAGLEAAIVSLVEPGDRVVVGECGRFGLLLVEIAERCGAEVVPVRAEWGRVLDPAAIEAALGERRTRLVAVVHGETSTASSSRSPKSRGSRAATTPCCWPTPWSPSAAREVGRDDWGVESWWRGRRSA